MLETPASALRILAACSPGEVRVAVVDDQLLDYAIWRPGYPDGVGDLHRGRVTAHVRALAGSFLTLDGAPDGFLPDSETDGRPLAGQLLAVRITRAAQGGKGPRLTAKDTGERALEGPVRLVQRGPGALERLAARYSTARIAIDDAATLAALRPAIGDRLDLAMRAFDPWLNDAVEALASSTIAVDGGGRIQIQPTAALTAIDIDLGSADASGGKTATHLGFNQALIPLLARQIRLRNLSGAILVDFAGLSTRRRAALAPLLQAALANDPVESRLIGLTGLGFAEISRRRVSPPLHEVLAAPHAAIAAALRAAIAAVQPGTTLTLHAAPDLLRALDQDAVMRADLARSPANALMLHADPSLPARAWRLGTAVRQGR